MAFEEPRTVASSGTDGRVSLRGQLSATPLHELLFAVEASAKSGQVRFFTDAGVATIWFRDGVLVDAELGQLVGVEAINRLVGVSEGRFELEYAAVARPTRIGRSARRILQEQAMRRSSWRELLGRAPSLDAILVPGDGCAGYMPEAELIALFDGRHCVLDVIERSGRDPVETLRVINGLCATGVLVPHRSLSEHPHVSGLTPTIPGAPRLPSEGRDEGTPPTPRGLWPEHEPGATAATRYSVRPDSVEVVQGVEPPSTVRWPGVPPDPDPARAVKPTTTRTLAGGLDAPTMPRAITESEPAPGTVRGWPEGPRSAALEDLPEAPRTLHGWPEADVQRFPAAGRVKASRTIIGWPDPAPELPEPPAEREPYPVRHRPETPAEPISPAATLPVGADPAGPAPRPPTDVVAAPTPDPVTPGATAAGPGAELADAPAEAAADGFVGPYEVICPLDRGGRVELYLCRTRVESGPRRLFVLRMLSRRFAREYGPFSRDAFVASRVRHPNVVAVVDAAVQRSRPYFVMEYVDGCSMETLLERSPKDRPASLVLSIVIDALAGLHAAHSLMKEDGTPAGVVHADLSPARLLVGIDGSCRVTGFGSPWTRGGAATPANASGSGAPCYASPEQLSGRALEPRSDVFSVGVILYEALTGVRLFAAKAPSELVAQVLEAPIPPPSQVGLRPPPFLDAACMRALERDPRRRYESAEQMLLELRTLATQFGLLATPSDVGAWVREAATPELQTRRLAALVRDHLGHGLEGAPAFGAFSHTAIPAPAGQARAVTTRAMGPWAGTILIIAASVIVLCAIGFALLFPHVVGAWFSAGSSANWSRTPATLPVRRAAADSPASLAAPQSGVGKARGPAPSGSGASLPAHAGAARDTER